MDQPASTASNSRRNWLLTGCVAVLFLAGGIVISRKCSDPVNAQTIPEPVTELPKNLFRDWSKPEVAFILSGQTFAYLQPCGCSEPQYGGLARRYNVMKMLEKKGWKMAGIDLGEIFPPKKAVEEGGLVVIPEQAMERFKTTLRALDVMNYQDFGLGISEMKMPLLQGLGQMNLLNTKKPRPLSLDLKDPNQVLQLAFAVRPYDVITSGEKGKEVKVGVSSLVGESVAKALKGVQDANYFDNGPMIRALLPKLAAEKVDVVILLVHSTPDASPKEAEDIAKLCFAERQKNPSLPNVDLIIHTSDFDTPPARPQLLQGTETRLIYPGHKGKDIGVLGLFRKPGGGFELKYEFIQLGPEFKTPDALVKDHPVMDLIQEYAQTVKDKNFLAEYKPFRTDHPTQKDPVLTANGIAAKYVGSDRCGDCHAAEHKVWQNAIIVDKHGHKVGHSIAHKSLEDAKNPNLRQFDPECVACHTTGFKYRTGYFDPPANANAKQIDKHNFELLNVGCESCHGPGSMHANNPDNAAYYPLINPIKGIDNPATPNAKVLADRFCQSCHDIENDVHWGTKKTFAQSWGIIRHTGLKNAPK